MRDDQSFSSWTVPSASEVESSAKVQNKTARVLDLSVAPHRESIGCSTPQESTKVCVHIAATALSDEEHDARPGVDVVACLDQSGSMDGNKFRDCKRTLQLMVKHLTSKDRFGLVVYGSSAKVVVPVQSMTPSAKDKASKKISHLGVCGMTNLSGGLSLAIQEMSMIVNPNPIRSIFLLTDGHANVGISDHDGLVALAKTIQQPNNNPEIMRKEKSWIQQAIANTSNALSTGIAQGFLAANVSANVSSQEQSPEAMLVDDADVDNFHDTKPKEITVCTKKTDEDPVSLFCFGYGKDHDSKTLRAMADAAPGGGSYYFVEKDEDVATAFGDAMGGLMSVVAQSAVISLSVPCMTPGAKILKVFHAESIEREDGSYTVNVGDFYAEESRDVVVEVRLTSTPSDSPVPHVLASLSYTDVSNKCRIHEGPIACTILRPCNEDQSPVNIDVEAQWLRVYVAEQIQLADRDAGAGNLKSARLILEKAMRFLEQSPAYQQHSREARGLWLDLKDTLNGFSSDASYAAVGTHYAKTCGMKISKQRQMGSQISPGDLSIGQERYATKSKKKMSRAFQKR